MSNPILVTVKNGLGRLHLNRPKSLNALSLGMIQSISHSLDEWEKDDNIKAVLITGEGDVAFCAGGDIRAIYDLGRDDKEQAMHFFETEYKMNRQIFHFKKPYIALMQGITMGGGLGVSVHGSLRVAANNLLCAMPETGIGFFPDIGSSYFLSRMPNGIGTYLALTGARMSAGLAKHLGLVDYVVDYTQFPNLAEILVNSNFSKESAGKMVEQYDLSSSISDDEQQLIDHANIFDKNSIADILASLMESKSALAEKTLNALRQKCPFSIVVAFELLQRAKHKTLDECLDMDTILVKRFLSNSNFYEGIRSVVIDKSQSPNWDPKTLEDVEAESVLDYFSGLL